MKRSGWLIASVSLWGCATGAPMGGRFALVEDQPYTRAAAPRSEPSAPTASETPVPKAVHFPDNARSTVIGVASKLVGKSDVVVKGVRYRDDCTGLVQGVFSSLGVNLMSEGESGDNGVTAIWRYASAHGRIYVGGRPVAGDLVFFHDTYDLNRDGRDNDGLTHIGLVESVEGDGTVVVIHRVAKGVVRYRMNLSMKDRAVSPEGKLVNDYLRVQGKEGKPLLTAELFSGYATLLPLESRIAPVASR